MNYPLELPEKPTGWTKQMTMHLNMGKDGHIGAYKVCDDKGQETPITFQYHTGDKDANGFTLPGVEPFMTWAELREIWPTWRAKYVREQTDWTELD